jgi:putative hydrolase of the HAD superfamily
MSRVVLWDFDGTLAHREGMWSGCLVDALNDVLPGHGHDRESFRPHLTGGFPWHAHETPHPELCEPDAWWAHVGELVANAYRRAGIDDEPATAAAARVRTVYSDHTRAWALYDDVIPALQALADADWRHAILSNHVPELPALVEGLGLDAFVTVVVNSATTGYEKPHPEAFAHARRAVGDPDELWMVGDNPVADVAGAEAAGISAMLVRRDGAPGLAAVVSRLARPGR